MGAGLAEPVGNESERHLPARPWGVYGGKLTWGRAAGEENILKELTQPIGAVDICRQRCTPGHYQRCSVQP